MISVYVNRLMVSEPWKWWGENPSWWTIAKISSTDQIELKVDHFKPYKVRFENTAYGLTYLKSWK